MVAGIGNVFLGDDGFGVEVASRLADVQLPEGVWVADYGISGMHLAYDLAEGYDTTILIDASPRGGEPGTVYLMEIDVTGTRPGAGPAGTDVIPDAHGMQPDVVLGMLGLLGAKPGRLLVVGCEPASTEESIGLSAPVAAAVDRAVDLVRNLVRDAGTDRQPTAEEKPADARLVTQRGGTHVPGHSG
jgi:hydrogenase maturation protease